MIKGLPEDYHVEQTEKGYRLISTRDVIRHDPNGSRLIGPRNVATFEGTSIGLMKRVADLDAMDRHSEVSEVLRQYGGGVIRWGAVDTNGEGPPKQNKGRHHDAVRVPNLEKKRKDAGFGSTAALSRASGVAQSHIRRIEVGVAKAGKDVLEKLARPLRISPEDLIA